MRRRAARYLLWALMLLLGAGPALAQAPTDTINLVTADGVSRADYNVTTPNAWTFQGGVNLTNATLSGLTQFGTYTPGPVDAYSIYAAPTSVGSGNFGNPAFYFNDLATTGFNFADSSTHFAMAVTGNSSTTGTGSYDALYVTQNCTDRDATAYCTGAQENSIQVLGSSNLGNYTGNNPTVTIPAGGGANTAVPQENDLFLGAPAIAKEGFRIADLSTALGTCGSDICAAIDILKASVAPGFAHGIRFDADTAGTDTGFPIEAGGDLIAASTTTLQLAAALNFSGMSGGFSLAAIVLPLGGIANNGIEWGNPANGGVIESQTNTGGPVLSFQNGGIRISTGTVYEVGTSSGVACSGSPTSSFAAVGGIVTHC